MMGRLTLEKERNLTDATKQMIEGQADLHPAYRSYLEQWGDWSDPFANMTGVQAKTSSKEAAAKTQMSATTTS